MKHRLLEALRDLIPTVRSTLVSVLAVAIVAATVLSIRSATTSVSGELRDERVRTAVALATAVDLARDTVVTSVVTGFEQLEPWDDLASIDNSRIQIVTSLAPYVLLAEVVNGAGIVAMSTDTLASQSRRGPALDAAREDRVVVTDVERDLASGADVLRIVVPLHDDAGVVAALGIATIPVTTGPLMAAVQDFADVTSEKTRVGIALLGGTVLTANGLGRRDDATWQEPLSMAGDTADVIEYESLGGELLLAATARTADGWTVIISQPLAEVEPALAQQRPSGAAVPGLGALLVLLAVLGVARRRQTRKLSRAADEAKLAFLSVTGHELRTPLTVMGGMLKTMDRGLARGNVQPETLAPMVDAARRNAQLLELRVERILLVAALEAGTSTSIQPRPINLHDLLDDLMETVSRSAPTHEFSHDVPDDLMVLADPKAVDQIMMELLNNGVRYTPGGGTIHVEARAKIRNAEITVTDNGVGLPLHDKNMFERFRQGEEGDQRMHDEGGVGLGLYIVKTLVTGMRGHVRAERLPDGTRLVVDIPLA